MFKTTPDLVEPVTCPRCDGTGEDDGDCCPTCEGEGDLDFIDEWEDDWEEDR